MARSIRSRRRPARRRSEPARSPSSTTPSWRPGRGAWASGPRRCCRGSTSNSAPGTITALIGPTGCGKSTFLRSLNRMNDKVRGYWRTGAIEFDGVEISGHDIDLLGVAAPGGHGLPAAQPLPHVGRRQRGGRRQGPSPVAAPRAAGHRRAVLREVGLWSAVADRLGDSPFRLSGGQQQLLCLARALAVEPDVLLLDEPTSSLDPVTTEMVEDLLRELAPGLTMVIVTHNLAQARRLAGTTAFLYNGRLVECGATPERSSRPRRAGDRELCQRTDRMTG